MTFARFSRRRFVCLVSVATIAVAASVVATVAVATPAHASVPVVLRAGFPVDTDLSTARPQDAIIDGTTAISGWFRQSSPTLADLYGNGQKEIIIGSQDGRVYVYSPSGVLLWARYLDAPSTAAKPVSGTPAVGDINGDGQPDIVAGSENGWVFSWDSHGNLLPGWPQFTGYNADYPNHCGTDACTGVVASPVVADLDGDGKDEVIVGSYSHKVYVWHGDGTVMSGWPRDVWDGVASGVAVGDLNGDGSPDIVIGSDVANDCSDCQPYGVLSKGGLLHAFNVSGVELPGWPYRTDSFMHGAPVLADLDGNGKLEVLSGGGFFPDLNSTTRGHTLYAINPDGTLRWSFHTQGVLESGPAVADINGDGKAEIAIADTNCLNSACVGGTLYLLGQSGAQVGVIWQRTDSRNANGGAFFGQPIFADVTGDGVAEVIEEDANFGVRAYDQAGNVVFSTSTVWSQYGTPAVGDLDNDGHNELVVGSAAGNGNGTTQTQAGAGRLYVYNTPGIGGLKFPQFQSRVVPTNFGPTCFTATASATDMPLVRRGAYWYQRDGYASGPSDGCFTFGESSDTPLTGDWSGTGYRTAGVFRNTTGTWYLSSTNSTGSAVTSFGFASPGDIPVAGDWDGDGIDKVGVFRPSVGTWYLASTNGAAPVVTAIKFASPGDIPVVGDWNGDGVDTVGVFRPSTGTWYIAEYTISGHSVSTITVTSFVFASPGDIPVVGDWNHDGRDTVGVFRGGRWFLKNSLSSGGADGSFAFGSAGDTPLVWS